MECGLNLIGSGQGLVMNAIVILRVPYRMGDFGTSSRTITISITLLLC
jgi:hypothetical protein